MKKRGPIFDFKEHRVRTIILIVAIIIAVFLLLGFISIEGWEYSNSTAFCATACHQVHPEEPVAFQDSYHSSVKCVECHMGRGGTIRSMILKAGHSKHLPAVVFRTYGRPLESESMRPASESCERCHNALSLHGDRLKEIPYYLPDELNMSKRRYLILKIGGRAKEKALTDGMHWHIINRVDYIARDEHKQEIPWVRVYGSEGQVVEYNDRDDPLPAEEIENAEKRTMDCLDCHNRVGHPFLTPEKMVNEALADERLSRSLPYAKKELTELLSSEYVSQEDAVSAAENLQSRYNENYPDLAAAHIEEIQRAAVFAQEVIPRLIFKTPGVTWKSFPNSGEHKNFPGCFRCHDGNHFSDQGSVIPLQCTLCHGIPATVEERDGPPRLPVSQPSKPQSHEEPTFIFDHRLLATKECASCHGTVAFGRDDSSFCANSACHGESWKPFERVNATVHPFPLEDKHQEPLCFQCHSGQIKPSDQCMDCHQPPRNHVRQDCAECHAPTGWRQSAASVVAKAVKIPHPLEGFEDCLQCHAAGGVLKPVPDNHRTFNSGQCTVCHKTAGNV
jgi:hypothetical protein